MTGIENVLAQFASFVWGMPLVALLLGGGLTLLLFSRGAPYRLLPHSIGLLRGSAQHDDSNAPGQLSHFEALSAALAGTIGLGNIAGVAVAVELGGPGAIFWMWMTAVVGVATKFFTGTLAVMYRGRDDQGQLRGGPMWVIHQGLSPRFRPLAYLFCIAGLIGCLPALQVNQLVETTQGLVLEPWNMNHALAPLAMGIVIMLFCWSVVRGGIVRIGAVASRLVPSMCVIYLLAISGILLMNWQAVVPAFFSIFREAFSPQAAGAGGLVAVMLLGVRRGLFSNEAGIGTRRYCGDAGAGDRYLDRMHGDRIGLAGDQRFQHQRAIRRQPHRTGVCQRLRRLRGGLAVSHGAGLWHYHHHNVLVLRCAMCGVPVWGTRRNLVPPNLPGFNRLRSPVAFECGAQSD